MMYKIIIKKKAKKFIDKLLQNEKSRVVSEIEKLLINKECKAYWIIEVLRSFYFALLLI